MSNVIFSGTNTGVGLTPNNAKLQVASGGVALQGSLTNASSRPAVSTTIGNNEIRAYSSGGFTADDGFIRITAGGGTSTATQACIELSGYSTIPDMSSNIVMRTAGAEKMRIDGNGNVGIGGTPVQKLTLIDASRTSSLEVGSLHVGATTAQGIRLGYDTAGHGWIQAANFGVTTTPLVLQAVAGNVGIGGVPSCPLHVIKSSNYPEVAVQYTGGQLLSMATGTAGAVISYSGYLTFGTATAVQLTSYSEKMRIDSSGRLGIGMTPTYPLDITYANSAGGINETGLRLTNTTTTNSTQINLNGNRSWSMLVNGSLGTPAGGFDIVDNTAGAARLTINSSGFVGLRGNPTSQLDVFESGNTGNTIRMRNTSNGAAAYSIVWLTNDGGNGLAMFMNSSGRSADGGVNGASIRNDSGALALQSAGAVGLSIAATTGTTSARHIVPIADNTYDLGTNGALRWRQIYAINTTILTSDRNSKQDIENVGIGLDFVNRLRPVTYKWIPQLIDHQINEKVNVEYTRDDGTVYTVNEYHTKTVQRMTTPDRTHYGFIAQEVKEVLDEFKIDPINFSAYVDSSVQNPELANSVSKLALRYEEFIPILTKAIQDLSSKNRALETLVASLSEKVQMLMNA